MGRSLLVGSEQALAGTITRSLLNTATAGSAVIAKVLAGTNMAISAYTGADSGTGDVTLAVVASPSFTNITAAGLITNAGTIRATNQVVPTSGAGTELLWDGTSTGYVQAYDRTANAWKNLTVGALVFNVQISGSTVGTFSSSGLAITSSVTSTGSNAAFSFADRTGTAPTSWIWYATGGVARLFNASLGDVMTSDVNGNITPIGRLAAKGIGYSTYYNAGNTYAPNWANSSFQYCAVTASGTIAPTNAFAGQMYMHVIKNTSGGSITVTTNFFGIGGYTVTTGQTIWFLSLYTGGVYILLQTMYLSGTYTYP